MTEYVFVKARATRACVNCLCNSNLRKTKATRRGVPKVYHKRNKNYEKNFRFQTICITTLVIKIYSCKRNTKKLMKLVDFWYHLFSKIKRRFFCMLGITRAPAKLMRIIYHLRLWLNSKCLFFDTFLNRQTNLKSMFSALSLK